MLHIRMTATLVFFVLSVASAAGPAYCGDASYIVTLTNGNTLEANSYRVEGDTVYLEFPVGEAAFKKSLISSIVTSDGKAEMFQTKGDEQKAPERPQPAKADTRPEAEGTDLGPVPTIPGRRTLEERRRALEKRREMMRPPQGAQGEGVAEDGEVVVVGREDEEDPQKEEINELVDDFFEAGDDEEKLDELEDKLDNLFE